MAASNWMFKGITGSMEFQEIGPEDASTIQKRNIRILQREKIVEVLADVSLADSNFDMGDTSTGGALLEGYTGTYKIYPATVVGSATRWVCTNHSYEPIEQGVDCYRESQVWERREVWEDYEWPTS